MSSNLLILNHCPVLVVSNIRISADFYCDKCGFIRKPIWPDPVPQCLVQREGFGILLFEANHLNQIQVNNELVDGICDVLYWTKEIETLRDELTERGVNIHQGPEDEGNGFKQFTITDPDGHVIQFCQIDSMVSDYPHQ